MALLKLDERTLSLNAIAGVVEEYSPTERIKGVAARVTALKSKLEVKQKDDEAFFKASVLPELQAIRKEVQDINEERYPELVKMREEQEKASAETK